MHRATVPEAPPVGNAPPPNARKSTALRPSSRKLVLSAKSQEARKLAAVILEVLGGERRPTEAAGDLQVSLPCYYALEARALEGLLGACEPRCKGPRRAPETEIRRLKRELERVERESSRSQALLRVTRRALGLSAPAAAREKPGGKRRRTRRRMVRALRAVRVLREGGAGIPLEDGVLGVDNVREPQTSEPLIHES